ncbi:septal ring factor EnvC (AmiA/AmiB activator) [Neorhizobium huautlense]|uniref:Septal ring factor EnvC (AmiA/AmiB activator) n=1 Tax=Neorhizobium huautlense TaxID=67774 RepID=A0ABT9PYP6_9HYPH|nr:murein hydrolase activator EnvC [Neorhizobium huautlense]MDP9839208.1 septal ring factor EnvC (AmiA/AmiB activator) [Neorhizobium huautlense]
MKRSTWNGLTAALPATAAVFVLSAAALLSPPPSLAQEEAVNAEQIEPSPQSAPGTPDNASAELQRKRDETRNELEELTRSIDISSEKARLIEENIAALEKSTANLRQALIDSATRRKELEAQILASEEKIAQLGVRQDAIKKSLHDRRAVLAEVLAALQRMGRSPPPALLVTPEDALGSVRSAILLGAVVPGMRKQATALVNDLEALTSLQRDATTEKARVSGTITESLEEDRRMQLLMAENDKQSQTGAADLVAEQQRTDELAARAESLSGLIESLENDITSIRDAAERARLEEERQKQLSVEEREKARQLAESGVPDKNRIAPAYPFSSLRQKLELPVAGDILRSWDDPDGTGHPARGMTVASGPNAVVTAPADGLVVFAGAFRSYGQMVILNAGDGYHVVMTGMNTVNVRQGKFVFAGEPIALMGKKRVASATALALETDRPTLYIEFRKDGSPVDSAPWWVKKDTGRARNDS